MEELTNIDDLLNEAKVRINLLTTSLPSSVDAASVSVTAKIPFKALDYREALIWRFEELARITCEMYERRELTVAMTLTRSCMEVVSVMWYLHNEIKNVVDSKQIGMIDETLMELLIGSKNSSTKINAKNILTLVNKVTKQIPAFRPNYDSLSEVVHPNWAGTSGLYSKPVPEEYKVIYGKNVRVPDSIIESGLLNLITSLAMFEHYYNETGNLMLNFIKICEDDLASNNKTS
jgi:hypothetical protein